MASATRTKLYSTQVVSGEPSKEQKSDRSTAAACPATPHSHHPLLHAHLASPDDWRSRPSPGLAKKLAAAGGRAARSSLRLGHLSLLVDPCARHHSRLTPTPMANQTFPCYVHILDTFKAERKDQMSLKKGTRGRARGQCRLRRAEKRTPSHWRSARV